MSKKEEKLRQEKELESKLARLRETYPIGALVRYNAGHGWYHARIVRIDRTAAIVRDLAGSNSRRIEFAALDKPMFETTR